MMRLPGAVRKQRPEIGPRFLLRLLGRQAGLFDQAPLVLRPLGPQELAELVIAERPKPDVHAYVWIWYFDTQSLIVDQSRLSKNALM